MSDRRAFLNTIRENPDDDTVRLVFADWLDDHGDPLAELIRVQIELEPIRDQLDNLRVQELTHRESILLATHGHEWLGPAADIASEYPAFGPVFRRGLPEMVCLSLDTFLRRGAELFEACPTVREVSLYGVSGTGLESGNSLDLALSRHLTKIETLEIADPGFVDEPDAVRELCESIRDARLHCFKIPAVFNPRFLHQLAGVMAAGWPRWIEFVQHRPKSDTDAEDYAAALDRIAGRPVTRILRPSAARFPLLDNAKHGISVGNADGPPTLLAIRSDGSGVSVVFDQDGGVEGASTFASISPTEMKNWERTSSRWVRICAFRYSTMGLAVRLWPRSYIRECLERPCRRPPGVSDRWWNSRGGVLRRWLHEGRFVIEWDGREYTLDSSGKIIASEAAG